MNKTIFWILDAALVAVIVLFAKAYLPFKPDYAVFPALLIAAYIAWKNGYIVFPK